MPAVSWWLSPRQAFTSSSHPAQPLYQPLWNTGSFSSPPSESTGTLGCPGEARPLPAWTSGSSPSQHDVCFKPSFLSPPPLERASSSSAGPGPPAHILTMLPLHSHLFVSSSLKLRPILWFRGPCGSAVLLPHSRVPSFLLEWITGPKSSWRLLLADFFFILRPPLSTASELVLCRCSASLSSFQGWWLGRDHRGGLGSSNAIWLTDHGCACGPDVFGADSLARLSS